ncbi:MAG: c-type cytochrome biogenesis protein CcmI [Betaproteobacteria bacterium]|nr:MAG: c-type cytochrome biogenesis protein CcmI [Betaproteobacteria bacterium]
MPFARRYNATSRSCLATVVFPRVLLFWFLVALLVTLTLAALLRPLLRARSAASAPDTAEASIAVYRDQKRSLDAEHAAGTMTTAEHEAALGDLARRVAEEAEAAPLKASPAPQRARWIAIALLVLMPSAAVVLYKRLGNPETATLATSEAGSHEVSEKQIAAMVDSLAQRLKQHPDDANGWVLLAHSYQALERFPEAADAYEHAAGLIWCSARLRSTRCTGSRWRWPRPPRWKRAIWMARSPTGGASRRRFPQDRTSHVKSEP